MSDYENINTEYATYNALGRQAMIMGVPVVALAMSSFVLVMATMLAMPFLQGRALLRLALLIPIFIGLRTVCETDDQALRIYAYEIKWFFRKRNAKIFNNTTTVIPTKYGRQNSDYQRFFQQDIQSAASAFRLTAANLPTRYQ
ncbi:VirB3 family type IV secretion system protein [Kingella negevensis]|uniref:VirB3 family type IV secretion system protein n=1 Tax=Kingella negevensis TaxID=1522312 RepID=UPI002549DE0B|nr:VirB3 family type IV secretion system protein [Kingella negevensis]MDK4696335.1 VirB3 family type IV secretion system protein [Kingella negevensis]